MPALIAASVCSFLVGMSRVYLGMHTIKVSKKEIRNRN